LARTFFGGNFFGGEFFNGEHAAPVVPPVEAGGGRSRRTIYRFYDSKQVEKALRKEIVKKPLKAKVAKAIARVIADDTEQLDTAVQRLRATLEKMREPIRADYIDYTQRLVAMAREMVPQTDFIDTIDMRNDEEDDELIAILAMVLLK
jgi:AcrR family transcriptional regulator